MAASATISFLREEGAGLEVACPVCRDCKTLDLDAWARGPLGDQLRVDEIERRLKSCTHCGARRQVLAIAYRHGLVRP